jgi:UDPglucose 6-dehydrogenase
VKGADCLVITMDHTAFKSLDLKTIMKLTNKPLAVVDGKHVLVPKDVVKLGITYRGLGRSAASDKNIWNLKLR